jgi:hypothetical protein
MMGAQKRSSWQRTAEEYPLAGTNIYQTLQVGLEILGRAANCAEAHRRDYDV